MQAKVNATQTLSSVEANTSVGEDIKMKASMLATFACWLLLNCFHFMTISGEQDGTIVKTKNGLVRGLQKTVMGATVDVYLGIPFAKPPVGDLRFKKPVPSEPWKDIYEAHNLSSSCMQERTEAFRGFRGEEMWNPNTPVSEDCLYLNLWVPRNSTNSTTLIWIYGGGFTGGTATLDVYDGLVLSGSNDVIVASMNYRLGPFGFLFTGDEEAPGNMGLYDQALAINWIKENIDAFGGNSNSLTLFGESAGAMSINIHLMSPVSQHLTRRAILQSGSINAQGTYMTAEQAKRSAFTLMDDIGCNSSLFETNSTAVMDCLRKVQADKLSKAQWNRPVKIGFPAFGPTIDGIFLTKDPEIMLQEGNFPPADILVGTNSDEGSFFALYDFLQYFNKDAPTALKRDEFLDIIKTIFKNSSQLEQEAIIFQYTDWEHLLGNEEGSTLSTKKISDVMGDYFFTCPVNKLAQTFAEHGSNVYYYYFTHRSSSNPWGDWMGIMHGDEIEYVFGHPFSNTLMNFTDKERDLSRRMMNYFSSFAKTGKPTAFEGSLAWPKYSTKHPRYFILNGEISGLGYGPRATACAFWNNFIPRLRETNNA